MDDHQLNKEKETEKVEEFVANDRRLIVSLLSVLASLLVGLVCIRFLKRICWWNIIWRSEGRSYWCVNTFTPLFQWKSREFHFAVSDYGWDLASSHSLDPESKMQIMCLKTCNFSASKKVSFHVVESARKVMATVFWDAEWAVFVYYVELSITGAYADLIGKVFGVLKDKGQLYSGCCFTRTTLNALAHASSQTLAATKNYEFELLHTTPDLALNDF